MSAIIHSGLKKHLRHFREKGDGAEARYMVLTELMMYDYGRGRAWPSHETLAANTGFGPSIISKAIKWLFEHKAIYNVPYRYRMGDEAELEPGKYVYQLTGVIELGGKLMPYVYMDEDGWNSRLRDLKKLGKDAETIIEAVQEVMPKSKSDDDDFRGEHADSAGAFSADADSAAKGISSNSLEGIESSLDDKSQDDESQRPVGRTDAGKRKKRYDPLAANGLNADDMNAIHGGGKPVVADRTSTEPSRLEREITAKFPGLVIMVEDRKRLGQTVKVKRDDSVTETHASPADLYDTDALFQEFTKIRLNQLHALYNKTEQDDSGKVQKRGADASISNVVSSIRKYDKVNAEKPAWNGWLAFKAEKTRLLDLANAQKGNAVGYEIGPVLED